MNTSALRFQRAILALVLTLACQPAPAQTPLPDEFNAGGFSPLPTATSARVYALAVQTNGKILVGGEFSAIAGQGRTSLAHLNADGTLDGGFVANTEDRSSGTPCVRSVVVQPDGKILVGGMFTTLGGQSRNNIARLNANGTVDSEFNPGAGIQVLCLALQPDGKILVGGNFSTLGGLSRSFLGRLNAHGTLDTDFTPAVGGTVYSLAVQPDGKILVGGQFGSLGGQTRNNLGRLNANGTLDEAFNPSVGGSGTPRVFSLVTQADGKILIGGGFSLLGGQTRNNIGRLNANGTLDEGFNPGAGSYVYSLVLQADGKILAGGDFITLGGQTRSFVGRLGADGTLDSDFNPAPNQRVYALTMQPDGRVLLGGTFTTVGGQSRRSIARLTNAVPTTQALTCDATTITWMRSGNSPEIWRACFEASTNAVDWFSVGEGVRIPGGWQFTDPTVPANATIRARGFITGGQYNGSSWFVESLYQPSRPWIVLGDLSPGFSGNRFTFNCGGSNGAVVIVEASTNLTDWQPLQTNLFGPGLFPFTDVDSTNCPVRFYRLRLAR